MHPVRLAEVGGHLCQQLTGGYPDIYSKAQFLPDTVPDLPCRFLRCPEQVAAGRHIHEGLVHAELLHHIRILPQDLQECPGTLLIQAVVRRNQHQVRAALLRLGEGLSGLYAIVFRRDGFRQDDAVPEVYIPSHRRRNLPQVQRPAPVV